MKYFLLDRFMEGIVKWFYSLFFGHGYSESDYWISIWAVFLILCVLSVIVYVIYCLVYNFIDKKASTVRQFNATVIDKKYLGEQTTSGVGTAVLSNGGVGIVSTSSTTDEEFLLFVKADKVYKVEVDMQQFYQFKLNDTVNISVRVGGLSKEELSTEII